MRTPGRPRGPERPPRAKNRHSGDGPGGGTVTCPIPPDGPLLLLLSDLHLGRGAPEATRAAERDALALLDAHVDALTDGGTLVLLGDVFEQYLEYRHLLPKTGLRLIGRLAALADAGAEVVYVVGNRDPWHLDVFEAEIGAVLVRDVWRARRAGRAVYIEHGDRLEPSGPLASRLKPLLRVPLMARLYRMSLPGDAGYGLMRWVSARFGSDGAPVPEASAALAAAARGLLATTDADLVAFGHVHEAALEATPHGAYLNPGYWFGDRTFAVVDGGAPALYRWRDGAAEPLRRPAALAATS